jgi:hypothetical protein
VDWIGVDSIGLSKLINEMINNITLLLLNFYMAYLILQS